MARRPLELSEADWTRAASWSSLAKALESEAAKSLASAEPVTQVQTELDAKRNDTKQVVRDALAIGRSVKRPNCSFFGWSHEGILTVPLATARDELLAFPRISSTGKRLGLTAALALELRKAL